MDSFLKLKVCINPLRVKGVSPQSSAATIETKDGKIWKCDWKFVAFVPAASTVGQLREEVLRQYKCTYPSESINNSLVVERIRTDDHFDVAGSVTVQQAFGSDGVAFVLAKKISGVSAQKQPSKNTLTSTSKSPLPPPIPPPRSMPLKDGVPAMKRKRDADEESEQGVASTASINITTPATITASADNPVDNTDAPSKAQRRKRRQLAQQQKMEASQQASITQRSASPSTTDASTPSTRVDSAIKIAMDEEHALQVARDEVARRESRDQANPAEKGAAPQEKPKAVKPTVPIKKLSPAGKAKVSGVDTAATTNADEEATSRQSEINASMKALDDKAAATVSKKTEQEAASKKELEVEADRKIQELMVAKNEKAKMAAVAAVAAAKMKLDEEQAGKKQLRPQEGAQERAIEEEPSQGNDGASGCETSTPSLAPPPLLPAKRKPGRPPKAKPMDDTASSAGASEDSAPVARTAPARHTRRQTKGSPAEDAALALLALAGTAAEPASEEPVATASTKRKPGRPAKTKLTEGSASASTTASEVAPAAAADGVLESVLMPPGELAATSPSKPSRRQSKARQPASETTSTTVESEPTLVQIHLRNVDALDAVTKAPTSVTPLGGDNQTEEATTGSVEQPPSGRRRSLIAVELEAGSVSASPLPVSQESVAAVLNEKQEAPAVTATASLDAPVKRKPGRPPKAKPADDTDAEQKEKEKETPPSSQESAAALPSGESSITSTLVKRKPGRLSKAKATQEAPSTTSTLSQDSILLSDQAPMHVDNGAKEKTPSSPIKHKPSRQPKQTLPAEDQSVSAPAPVRPQEEEDTAMVSAPLCEVASPSSTSASASVADIAAAVPESPNKDKRKDQEPLAAVDRQDKEKEKEPEEEAMDEDDFDPTIFSSLRKSQQSSNSSSPRTPSNNNMGTTGGLINSTGLKPKVMSYMLDVPRYPPSSAESQAMRPMSLSALHHLQQQKHHHALSRMDEDTPPSSNGAERPNTPQMVAMAMMMGMGMGDGSESESDEANNSSQDEEAVETRRARGSWGVSVSGPPPIASSVVRRHTLTSPSLPSAPKSAAGLAISGLHAEKEMLPARTTRSKDVMIKPVNDNESDSDTSSSSSESDSDEDSDTSTSSSSSSGSSASDASSMSASSIGGGIGNDATTTPAFATRNVPSPTNSVSNSVSSSLDKMLNIAGLTSSTSSSHISQSSPLSPLASNITKATAAYASSSKKPSENKGKTLPPSALPPTLPPPLSASSGTRPSSLTTSSSSSAAPLSALSALSGMPVSGGGLQFSSLTSLAKAAPFLKSATIGRNKAQNNSTPTAMASTGGGQRGLKSTFLDDLEDADAARISAFLDKPDSSNEDGDVKKTVRPRRFSNLSAALGNDGDSDDGDYSSSDTDAESSSGASDADEPYDKSVRKTAAKMVRVAGSKRKADEEDGEEESHLDALYTSSTTDAKTNKTTRKALQGARGAGRKRGRPAGRGKSAMENMF